MKLNAQQHLATLISFDTTSRLSNLELIRWIEAYFQSYGISSRLTYNDEGTKANLFARIGDDSLPVMLLSGHTDVVPVDGQDWETNPFELTDKGDGKLYGRGTADMKGFIACMLAIVPECVRYAKEGRLKQAIGFAFSYDEELGCLGVGRLVQDVIKEGIQFHGCIIGEPSSMLPVIGHKGIAHYRCIVIGKESHSSLAPQGVNAIEYAGRLIAFIQKLATTEASFGQRQALYNVPYTTIQVCQIEGGIAPNIVPKRCEFIFECRWLPGDPHERFLRAIEDQAAGLLSEMQAVAPESTIRIEQIIHAPAFNYTENSVVFDCVHRLCGGDELLFVPYATEAGIFHEAGIPCVVLGPGNIAQAHRPNEYVEIEQLHDCERWLLKLLEDSLA